MRVLSSTSTLRFNATFPVAGQCYNYAMPDKAIIDDGATQVGIAWLIKELFAFLIKWGKAKEDTSTNDSWKDFCREQFASIKDEARGIRQKVEMLEDKIQDLKMEHRKCGGKD